MRKLSAMAAVALLCGCMTRIEPPETPPADSVEKLGGYPKVFLAPPRIDRVEADAGSVGSMDDVEKELIACMREVFPGLKVTSEMGEGLAIQPVITDLKRVSFVERLWFGPLPGSSAVVMTVRFTDTASHKVLAEPAFHARAFAAGAAATMGYTDSLLPGRIARQACDYAQANR